MKKVLILSYYFPPYEYTGGQRVYGWYKNLKKFNIYPVIVTRHWDREIKERLDSIKPSLSQDTVITNDDNGTIIRVGFMPDSRDKFFIEGKRPNNVFAKRLFNLYSKLRFISLQKDKTAALYRESDTFLEKNPCNVIIASGGPFILFKYAHLLSKKHSIPWIADYRDGWSTNALLSHGFSLKNIIYPFLIKIGEKKYVQTATVITSAAEPYKKKLQDLFPGKHIEVIYNGYNPENIILDIPQKSNSLFTIAYAGKIYPFQKLEIFLEGFKLFVKESNCSDSRIIFYGLSIDNKQLERLLSFDEKIKEYIVTTPLYPKKELFKKLYEADAMLLLSNEKINTLASKIFDCLALNRKIILVPDDHSVMSKILDDCSAGIKCSTAIEVKNMLTKLYNEFKLNGSIQHQTVNFEKYRWEVQTESFSKILNSIH
jgi:glycosyltransferase involved in cell wall biosynthesis